MDLPRLFAMDRYWQKHPPLRDMVQAAFFGPIEVAPAPSRAPATSGAQQNTEQDLDSFVQMFGAAGGKVT